jgi:hypothetical protein
MTSIPVTLKGQFSDDAIQELKTLHRRNSKAYRTVFTGLEDIQRVSGGIKVVIGIPGHVVLPPTYNLTHPKHSPTVPVMAAYLSFLLRALGQGYLPQGRPDEMVLYFKDTNNTGAVHAFSAGFLERYAPTPQIRETLATMETRYASTLNEFKAGSSSALRAKTTLVDISQEVDGIFLTMGKPHTPLLTPLAEQIQPGGSGPQPPRRTAAQERAAQNAQIPEPNNQSVAMNNNVAQNTPGNGDPYQQTFGANAGGATAGRANARGATAGRAQGGIPNNERQGIAHRIGNILYQHRNNNGDNNAVNDRDIPRWMRNVYGVRRARKILARQNGSNTTNNKKGLTFRRLTFANLPSFIPRHH